MESTEEYMHHACRRHTLDSCPTTEWMPNMTAICMTHDNKLVHARVFDTTEAAETQVTSEIRWQNRAGARYDEVGLPRPPQFTPEYALRHLVWRGEDKPTHDAWGHPVT